MKIESKEKGGFGIVYNEIIRNASLSPLAKVVYTYLTTFANKKDECYPGIKKMSANLGMQEKTTKKYLKELESRGVVSIHERYYESGQRATNYYLISHEVNEGVPPNRVGVVVWVVPTIWVG